MNSDLLAGFLTGFLMLIKISLRISEENLTLVDLIAGALWGCWLYAFLGPACDLLSKNYIRSRVGRKSNRFYRYDQPGMYTLCAIYNVAASAIFASLIIVN